MTDTQKQNQPPRRRRPPRKEPDYGALGAQLARDTAPPLTEEQVEAAARLFMATMVDRPHA